MASWIETLAFLVPNIIVPVAGLLLAAFAFFVFLRSQSFSIKAGSFRVEALNKEADEIRSRLEQPTNGEDPSARQYALLKEYHSQGLAQSKISFWFSLLFASFGFLIIVISIFSYVGFSPSAPQNAAASPGLLDSVGRPIFTLVAGTVIEAVAALFFVQSNKARQLMTDFFDKARLDRKLDESLALASQIDNQNIAARLKAFLAISFAEINPDQSILMNIFSEPGTDTSTAKPLEPST